MRQTVAAEVSAWGFKIVASNGSSVFVAVNQIFVSVLGVDRAGICVTSGA